MITLCVLTIIAACLGITAIILPIYLANGFNPVNKVEVETIHPSKDNEGGSTTYKVPETASVLEANKSIILTEYENSISESDATRVAEKIIACGGGKIKSSFIGGPPTEGAFNWRNFRDENKKEIDTYMFHKDIATLPGEDSTVFTVYIEGCK